MDIKSPQMRNEIIKVKNENTKLKTLINHYKKEKKDLRNSLYKLEQLNTNLNRKKQSPEDYTNYNKTISSIYQEMEQLKKITEENNHKSLEYKQQINNLKNILNKKDKMINQYKEI